MIWFWMKIAALVVLFVFYAALYQHRQSRLLRRAVDEFGFLLVESRTHRQAIDEQRTVIDKLSTEINWLHSQGDLADVERFSATLLQTYTGQAGSPKIKGYVPYTLARCPFSNN